MIVMHLLINSSSNFSAPPLAEKLKSFSMNRCRPPTCHVIDCLRDLLSTFFKFHILADDLNGQVHIPRSKHIPSKDVQFKYLVKSQRSRAYYC